MTDFLPRLPSVVALPLQDYLGEDRAVLKLWHACDTVEMLLRLLTSAGLADVARADPLPDTLVNELRSRIEEPTLGSWRAMAEVVAAHLAKMPDCVLPELAVYVRDALVPFLNGQVGSERTTETSFIALRNRLAHGGAITKKRAKELCDHWAKSFEQIICAAAWLAEVDIVVRFRAKEFGVLRGATTEPAVWTPPDPAAVEAVLPREGEIALCRGGRVLPLAPLQFFGLPVLPEEGATRLSQATPLVYLRRGEVRLQFTPVGSDEACQSDGDATAWEVFRRMFRLDEAEQAARSRDFLVRGFETDLQKDARRVVGRARETEDLLAVLRERSDGVLWLSGPAGIGKSHLVARVAYELLEAPPAGTFVLAYRFRAGDDRCSRQSFLQFANERLERFLGCPAEKETDRQLKPLERFRKLLDTVSSPAASEREEGAAGESAVPSPSAPRRVLLILDGLDEIAERDSRFAPEVVLHSAASGVMWLCAGREERGLDQEFAKSRRALPEGLGPMTKDDIRAMLLERIGKLRQRLIANDRERSDEVINPFIDRVAKAADGLPLYVTYLIGDILGNRFRALDAGERLPESLVHYQEELLNRLGIDDVQQLKTMLAATLAVAFEPLSAAALADLLHRRTLLASAGDVELVHRALGAIGSIIRRSLTPDGEVGFTLYHQSLREYMLCSERMMNSIATTGGAYANAANEPGTGAAAGYLFRRGIEHLLTFKRSAAALGLLCSFRYLMARLQRLGDPAGVAGIGADWRTYVAMFGSPSERNARLSEAFWRERTHILRRGNTDWPAYKILLQLAIEHSDDSPLSLGAERWIAEGRCNWIWFRRNIRLQYAHAKLCTTVLEGHTGQVGGALVLESGTKILSWANDKCLRLWDRNFGECVATFEGHTEMVQGALVLPDLQILSWAGDSTIRLWDRVSGKCSATFEGFSDGVSKARLLADGRVLFWSETKNRNLEIRDVRSVENRTTLEGHSETVDGVHVLPDGRILAWSHDNTMHLWDSASGKLCRAIEMDSGILAGVLTLADGNIFSWTNENSIHVWNSRTGTRITSSGNCSNPLSGTNRILGAVEMPDQNILLWSTDKALRIWNPGSASVSVVFEGHSEDISGALVLSDDQILSWGWDKTLRIWEKRSGKCIALLEGHTHGVIGALALPDGQILSWAWDKTLRIWSRQSGKPTCALERHTDRIRAVLALSDGNCLAWSRCDAALRIWDSHSGRSVVVLGGHEADVRGALELENGRILSWSWDTTLRIWNARTAKCLSVLAGHSGVVNGAFVLPDGKVLSWSDDKTLRIWDNLSSKCIAVLKRHSSAVLGALLLSDGNILSYSEYENSLCIWEPGRGECLVTFNDDLFGVTGAICVLGALEIPDGRILSWATDDRLRIWDRTSGECIMSLVGHTKEIAGSLALDGERALSWSDDKTLRIWSSRSGECVSVLQGHAGAVVGCFLETDERIFSWSSDKTLRIWDWCGKLIAVYAIDDGLRLFPRFRLAYAGRERNGSRCLFDEIGGSSRLRYFAKHSETAYEWHGDSPCLSRYLRSDGSATLTQDDGQVCFLKLCHGNRPISLSEIEALQVLGETKEPLAECDASVLRGDSISSFKPAAM